MEYCDQKPELSRADDVMLTSMSVLDHMYMRGGTEQNEIHMLVPCKSGFTSAKQSVPTSGDLDVAPLQTAKQEPVCACMRAGRRLEIQPSSSTHSWTLSQLQTPDAFYEEVRTSALLYQAFRSRGQVVGLPAIEMRASCSMHVGPGHATKWRLVSSEKSHLVLVGGDDVGSVGPLHVLL